MKKHNKSSQRSEPSLKRTKARGPVQRDAKEVLAEVLGKLTGKPNAPAELTRTKENRRGNTVGPNRDRLTVGVDLGDRWSQYCILGLEGETLAEGQLRTTLEDVREFFQALTVARVVMEVGTHSAWMQDVITEWGHELPVANPRVPGRTSPPTRDAPVAALSVLPFRYRHTQFVGSPDGNRIL